MRILLSEVACYKSKQSLLPLLQIHTPGTDAPYVVRGPTYLKDRKKIPAGLSQLALAAIDVIQVWGWVMALVYESCWGWKIL